MRTDPNSAPDAPGSAAPRTRPRRKLIACEVFYRELCALASSSGATLDLEFLPKGLHDLPSADMRSQVQARIDAVPPAVYDAVLLAYGLCNNGLAGIRARELPLVIPRAHDCITLFLGSRTRYQERFSNTPGCYYLTSGWIERGSRDDALKPLSIGHRAGMDRTYEELVEAYGEDNAAYLREMLGGRGEERYRALAFIAMGVGPESGFEAEARRRAEEKDWIFERLQGDMGLLQRLANGPWTDVDFLHVPPGHQVHALYEREILRAETVDDDKGEDTPCAT